MKTFVTCAAVMLSGLFMQAQISVPQPSPAAKLEQQVGLTQVSVVYSRPSMKGRTIFGDLVPYGAVWRTGANANTIVTFSDEVTVGGTQVPAGSYALYSVPGAEEWEIMLYKDTENWGVPADWDASKVVAKVKAEVYKLPWQVETFTIDIDELTNSGAKLGMVWSDQYVAMPFEVPTDTKAMASIEKVMASGEVKANDYFGAAVYYLENGKDLDKAQEWIDKAIGMQKEAPFWMLRQKSLIHAAKGDKKGAIAVAKQSLAAAEKAGNADYVALNKKSLKEWGAM